MNETEIEILVLKAQAGHTAAFGRLYEHFYLPMRKFALFRVADVMIAEDLVQTVWLKITKRITRLHDVSLFRSWLYKALRWEIVDWQRKANKEVVLSAQKEAVSPQSDGEETLDALPLLRALKRNERDVAELFYLNDLSVREVSLIVGIPVGTVKSRLHRAREQLKDQVMNANEEKYDE